LALPPSISPIYLSGFTEWKGTGHEMRAAKGRVIDTEVGDEEGYYQIENTKDNGREVDVHLDEAFNVLGHENN